MNIYWLTKINKKTFFKTSRTEVSKVLRERGHNVKLVIERNIGEKSISDKDFISLPTVPCRIISRILFGLVLFFVFPLMIRKEKIDVIIVDASDIWIPFVIPLKFLKIPLIFDVRTLPVGKEKSMETAYYEVSFFLSKYIVNGLTTITPELKNILVDKYKLEENMIGIWTSGASKEFISRPTDKKKVIKIQKDLACIYLMYHGSYDVTRGIEMLIESIAELKNSLKKKIKLMLVGVDQTQVKNLAALSKTLNIHENIEIIPPVDYQTIHLYIDVCDVGVIPLPTNYIWWHVCAPIKTLEYLARGKPIISTEIPFHKRIFEKGNCGLLLDSINKKILAEAITKIYLEKDKLKKMGEMGREIVEKYYTWENSAVDLETHINKIILGK